MKDLAYAFTILFVTLGPLKIVPPFYLMTLKFDQRTILSLALRSTIMATLIVLFIALFASGMLVKWRVSVDAVAIAGGIMLLINSINTLTGFALFEVTPSVAADDALVPTPAPVSRPAFGWVGKPVLSPLAIPIIVAPIGVVAILFFAGAAVGDNAAKVDLTLVLLAMMGLNFVAMLLARPIMRIAGVPVLQVIGWVFAALQAGLAVQTIIGSLRRLSLVG